ncbi:myozenin-3 isoform X1 [Ahaetulla prasina]|uniref:myozenin-3 isoform X1 n=2 Tax=Ahaetulla prasina TaxID=499056 RepID=UPI00264A374D|nr:myozenin-3 isoform X1 [Ahaetulla prasina]XP_058025695.1 myozenin-3 isoform X1 [Ahaetulla prasina]
MFPLPRLYLKSEQYEPIKAIVKDIHGEEAPELDLGKKVSTPQDLMMEELSLSINRGSRLYQQRQKRVQRFVLENPAGYKIDSNMAGGGSHPEYNGMETTKGWRSAHSTKGKENYQNDINYMEGSGKRGPPQVPQKTDKVLRMSKSLNPSAIAPGYSGPLKEVPPEKFNRTAIPKGYRSPWREFFCNADYQVDVKNHLPEPRKVNNLDIRNFNRTPTPFGGPLLIDAFPGFDGFVPLADAMNDVMLLSERPSFNRTPQGWIHVMPESEDL